MNGWVMLLILTTSVWVLIDASVLGVRKGLVKGFFDMGPVGWFLVCLLLWIIGFPAYLAMRGKLKAAAAAAQKS